MDFGSQTLNNLRSLKNYLKYLNHKEAGFIYESTGDKISFKKYVILKKQEGMEIRDVSPDYGNLLSKYFGGQVPIIAQIGPDVSIKLDSEANNVLFIRNVNIQDVRKFIFGDAKEYKHKLEFIIAEYHGFVRLCSMEDDQSINYYQFGGAPMPKGGYHGQYYIRDETYYYDKYYHGMQKIEPGQGYPKYDKANLKIEFELSDEQRQRFLDGVKKDIAHMKTGKEDFLIFAPKWLKDWFGWAPYIGHNCHGYSDTTFKRIIDSKGKLFDYAKVDETNTNDKGIMFLLADYSTWDLIVNWRAFIEVVILQRDFASKISLDILTNYEPAAINDAVDAYGNTRLHGAVASQNFKVMLQLLKDGARLDVQNKKGEIPLGIYAGLPESANKYKYVDKFLVQYGCGNQFEQKIGVSENALVSIEQKRPPGKGGMEVMSILTETELCKKYIDYINKPEIDNTGIPLTHAVKANDDFMVRTMLKAGANASYTDSNGETLMGIALYSKAYKVVDELYNAAPELAYVRDAEYQLPIAEICTQKDKFDIDEFGDLCDHYDPLNHYRCQEDLLHMAHL